jgi:hypothetical protein
MQAMNFGALLPDVKANLPLPGQTLGNGSNIVERACVPGIEANCTHVPFTSIMVSTPWSAPAFTCTQCNAKYCHG